MLYEKSKSEKLDNSLFKNPTSEFRGAPFWAWNCALDKAELLWQIEELKKMGYGGFHMHVRQGMATEYLSDEFMDLISSCVDKAKTEKMKAYLYDEDMWPSGFAGGLVTKNKKFRQRYLLFINTPFDSVSYDEAFTSGEPTLLAVYDISLTKEGNLKSYARISATDEAKGLKRYAYLMTKGDSPRFNNQTYVDTINKDAIDEFIKVTHERYKDKVGQEFGKTVPSIFTDEPQYIPVGSLSFATTTEPVSLPWSPYMEGDFKAKYGYDILDKLPELFWIEDGKTYSTTRYHFQDFVCQRFTDSFAKNIGEWCDKNGIALTGHMMREDTLWSQTCSIGEAMRAYKYFGIPGIDLLCNMKEFNTAKQCQSIVHQYGKQGMLSELYGVTDWTFDFRGHKYQGDCEAALGVTLRVPHLSWVSMKGSAKRDYPANFNYQTPWYKEYPYIEDHFARVNTALTRGKPVVKVAVVHPIESYWLHMGPEEVCEPIRTEKDKHFVDLTDWLLGGCIDFDFICESDIISQKVIADKSLTIGEMTYDAVIMPNLETIRSNTLSVLDKFATAGGKLVILNKAPTLVDAMPSDDAKILETKGQVVNFEKRAVLDALEDNRVIAVRNNSDGKRSTNLMYAYRTDGDCDWLFIVHKDVGYKAYNAHSWKDIIQRQDITITVKGKFVPTLYDTLTGEIKQLEYKIVDGDTVITHGIYESDSLLIKLSRTAEDYIYTTPNFEFGDMVRLLDGWTITREEDNVILLDQGEYAVDGEWKGYGYVTILNNDVRNVFGYSGAQCQPWVLPADASNHSVTMKYTFDCDYAVKGACLATEDADIVTITVNGKQIEKSYKGYLADKSIVKIALPKLKKGKNEIVITLPYGERTSLEPSYITGDFAVKLIGAKNTIVKQDKTYGFGNIVNYGMPFYGGNLVYKNTVTVDEDGSYEFIVNAYRGATVKLFVDGIDYGQLAFMPYSKTIDLKKGEHKVEFKLFGNRKNTFGSLHKVNKADIWYGPGHWMPEREEFCYEYLLAKTGILTAPIIRKVSVVEKTDKGIDLAKFENRLIFG